VGAIKKITLICFLVLVIFSFSGCSLFQIERYTLTVELVNEDGGRVNIDPLREEYIRGSRVKLTAESEPGWYFSEWKKDGEGKDLEIQIIMDSHKIVLAQFEQEPEGIEEVATEIFNAYKDTLINGTDSIEPFLAPDIFHHKNHTKEDYLLLLKGIAENENHNISFWDFAYRYQVDKIIISGMCEEITADGTFIGTFEILLKIIDDEWKMHAFLPQEGILPLGD